MPISLSVFLTFLYSIYSRVTICLDMYIVHTYTRWCSPSCKLVGLSPITTWTIDMSSINQLLSQVINELHRHESSLNPNNSLLFLGEINLFFWFQLRYHLGVRFWRQAQLKNLSRYREEVTGGEIFRILWSMGYTWDILGIYTWISVGIYDGIYPIIIHFTIIWYTIITGR